MTRRPRACLRVLGRRGACPCKPSAAPQTTARLPPGSLPAPACVMTMFPTPSRSSQLFPRPQPTAALPRRSRRPRPRRQPSPCFCRTVGAERAGRASPVLPRLQRYGPAHAGGPSSATAKTFAAIPSPLKTGPKSLPMTPMLSVLPTLTSPGGSRARVTVWAPSLSSLHTS